MITGTDVKDLTGKQLVGSDGHKIGKIADVYEAVDGGEATFATVSTGLFGKANSFVALHEATLDGDQVSVPYDKDTVKDAPRIEADQDLTAAEEDRLYSHYGVGTTQAAAQTTGSPSDIAAPAADATTTAPVPVVADSTTQPADTAMTRSEERVHVGVERVATGTARLRKRIVTEQVSTTVPVSHEELVVTREPITDGATTTGDLVEDEQTITLHEERPVVAKETVPVERVQVGTDTVTEQREVNSSVRKEVIDLDDSVTAER